VFDEVYILFHFSIKKLHFSLACFILVFLHSPTGIC